MSKTMEKKYDVFVICPVRNVTEAEKRSIMSHVVELESGGLKVYWPSRDTDQKDPIGLRICSDNRSAIEAANEVHVFWNASSTGSLFDLGMAFALRKKIVIINRDGVPPTPQKSFNNVLRTLDKKIPD